MTTGRRTLAGSLCCAALVLALVEIPSAFGPTTAGQAPASSAAPAALTPAQAAPFLGDWTLALQGPNGPAQMDLVVKTEAEKVVAELSVPTMATQPITQIALVDKSLSLSYTFDYEGNAVDAVVWLTPGADGAMAAEIDFAGGAYVMSGTASKKPAATAPASGSAPGAPAAPR